MKVDKDCGIEEERKEETEISKSCHPRSSIFHFRFGVPVFGLLVLLGAMFWAKSRDPFERIWFSVRTPSFGSVKGVAVLPRPFKRRPVVVYLHGSGGTLMSDGNALRRFAELGMAAVGIEYNQTKPAVFDEHFVAIQKYIQRQSWALSDETVWVGFSLGAQRTLSFILNHPGLQPQLLVRLSGGWVSELDEREVRPHPSPLPQEREKDGSPPPHVGSYGIRCPVLLVHGEKDEIFPAEDARRLEELLQTNGTSVDLKIFPNSGHGFEADQALVMRLIGEYCKAKLTPEHPLPELPRLGPVLSWVCMVPAFVWAGICLKKRNRHKKAQEAQEKTNKVELTGAEKALRWVAAGLALLAIADTAVHLVPPHFQISDTNLNIARKWLVPSKWKPDFEALAGQPIWVGQRLKTLLEHVELAHYTVNELVNWKVDGEIYTNYVLSPVIGEGFDLPSPRGVLPRSETDARGSALVSNGLKNGQAAGLSPVAAAGDVRTPRPMEEMGWRRALWESFYPRIRHEQTPEAAAEIVARYLRERVTVVPGYPTAGGIETIWKNEITDEKGFEVIYVAALRSVGVGARLDRNGKAEFWTGEKWSAAPRPLAMSFLW